MFRINYKLYPNLSDASLIKKTKETLKIYGVAVIENVLSSEEAEKHADDAIKWLKNFSQGLTDDYKSWKSNRMPYGPRWGMYQSFISHSPVAWKMRELFYPLFSGLWNEKKLLTSIDGASVFPPRIIKGKDWPHLDQTKLKDECYQGQIVLTNTTSAFRCTPKSNTKFKEVLGLVGKINDKSSWHKFKDDEIPKIKALLSGGGGKLSGGGDSGWQIPIHAPAGSIILWDSKTIHSAQRTTRLPTEKEKIQPNNKWAGWRCVFYVCQRPKSHFSKRNITTLRRCTQEGRTSNHWGCKMFAKNPGSRYGVKKIEKIENHNPADFVVKISGLLRKLTGLDEWK